MRGLEPFGTAKGIWSIIRELSLDEIREHAERPPKLLILSNDYAAAERIAANLTGLEFSGFVTIRRLDDALDDSNDFDAVVLFDPEGRPESKQLLDRIRAGKEGPAATAFLSSDPSDPRAQRLARTALLKQSGDRAVSFGRHLPAFRAAAVKQVNDETSMANAQFALIANVPTVIPIFGSIAVVGADFLLLTKNQLLLIFKVAAIHGEDIHDSTQLFREMIPVVGAGFFWRTIAREAAAMVPMMGGAIPKVAIAYTGTMAIGRAADFYYTTGAKPSKEMMKTFYQQATESLAKRQWLLRRNPRETETSFRLIEDDDLD